MSAQTRRRKIKIGRIFAVLLCIVLLLIVSIKSCRRTRQAAAPDVKQYATSYITAIAAGDMDAFFSLVPASYWTCAEEQYRLTKTDIQNTVSAYVKSAAQDIVDVTGASPTCAIHIAESKRMHRSDFKDLRASIDYFLEKPEEIWRIDMEYTLSGSVGSTEETALILDLVQYDGAWYVLNAAVDVENALHKGG